MYINWIISLMYLRNAVKCWNVNIYHASVVWILHRHRSRFSCCLDFYSGVRCLDTLLPVAAIYSTSSRFIMSYLTSVFFSLFIPPLDQAIDKIGAVDKYSPMLIHTRPLRTWFCSTALAVYMCVCTVAWGTAFKGWYGNENNIYQIMLKKRGISADTVWDTV